MLSAMYAYGPPDFDHFDAYTELVTRHGVDGVNAYVRENVHALDSFAAFLDTVGASRLLEQRRRARELVAA